MEIVITRWHHRLLWGIAFSAIAMVAWSVIFWMVSPMAISAYKPLPDEDAVIKALVDTKVVTGVYRFPGLAEGQPADGKYFDKHKRGPIGQIFYQQEGSNPYSPRTVILGLVHALLISALATGLLVLVLPALPTYARRLGFLFGLGLFAALALDFADSVRWQQSWSHHGIVALFDIVNGFISAIVLAWFVDPAAREEGDGLPSVDP